MTGVLPAKLRRRRSMVVRTRDLASIYARPDVEEVHAAWASAFEAS